MVRCEYCKKKSSVVLPCKACQHSYCTRCIQLEIHKCANLDNVCNDDIKRLEDKLMSAKMSQRQNIKI